MPKFGKSLFEALKDAGAEETGHGTVYYNGEDGNRAVYDVTARDQGAMIVNGAHATLDGELATSNWLPTSMRYFSERNIDTQKGWQRVP